MSYTNVEPKNVVIAHIKRRIAEYEYEIVSKQHLVAVAKIQLEKLENEQNPS